MLNQKMPLLFSLLIFSFLFTFISSQTVYSISESVPDDSDYNRATFQVDSSSENYYLKYSFSTTPTSRIGAFRFDFSAFDTASMQNQVLCTFVDASASDSTIVNELNKITKEKSACIGAFKNYGKYDGIFEYDKTKKLFVILLKTTGELESEVSAYVRTKETFLSVSEEKVLDYAKYSMIPFVIHISQFREKASKILFYSKTRDMQMYYVEGDAPYPERLFFGNVMSVYTNPNMVRMKYKNAETMILLTRPFDMEEPMGEQFQFHVKFFASDYLLDYYMGTNPLGREKNSPLAINMTKCIDPYYVILNYNQPENKVSLFIDEIYGKIKSISVATSFKNVTWDGMIENDLNTIDINQRKYELPKGSTTHMDVYKIECSQPLLLNFYYVDESAKIPDLSYGQVVIYTLKPNKVLSLPYDSGVNSPQLTVEVFNPTKDPFIMVNDGISEFIMSKNSLVKLSPMNTQTPLIIKERGGDSDTRVIVKVGYKTISSEWEKKSDNVVYNAKENLYVFSFPSTVKRYNYTYAMLETYGTNDQDNVKYCYGTNIGSAILPSTENCYRVSKDDKYTIQVMNPAVMYKDYEFDDTLIYYVSLKPTQENDKFYINENLVEYDAKNRNFESYPNVVDLESSTESTILNYPKDNDESVFYQITSCSGKEIKYTISNAYDQSTIVPTTTIAAGKLNYFAKFDNVFGETKLQLTGTTNDQIFVKHNGISKSYTPSVKSSIKLSFDQSNNAIIFPRPTEKSERFKYTVYIGKEGDLSPKKLTICSFVYKKELDNVYSREFSTYTDGYSLPINFKKIGLEKGSKFEAIAYIEQEMSSQMSFATELLIDTVGEIKEETIIDITTDHPKDANFSYYQQVAKSESGNLYFSFKNPNVFDVPVGAFRIELDDTAEGGFNTVQCAWVDDGADAMSMVEAVEEVADSYNSYCLGGKNTINSRIFNYIFSYTYTSDNKPRRLVIKVPAVNANTGFSIYIRKGYNTEIKQTGFSDQEEYGRQEEYQLTVMPYILDLKSIRGDDSTPDYVSKVLLYSKHLEMQMYYIDPKGKTNAPIRLFTGNVMLVYTNLNLAQQKYFNTKLILLSEYIRGQEHPSLGNSFRFHTKMFRSTDQIEYFVSNEATGRTINFPLSLEMNTCTASNNKYYYILNYNMAEEEMNLYLQLVFGSIKSARIASEINEEKWDTLVTKMTNIQDYFTTIPSRSQHIDIVEIQCNTPLLANVYYNHDQQSYSWVTLGDVVVKNLEPKNPFLFYLDTVSSTNMYYSVEIMNLNETPDVDIKFSDGSSISIKENALKSAILFHVPDIVIVVNNGNSKTRLIFKVGFGVENDWNKEQGYNIEGILYSKTGDNRFVYKLPTGTKGLNYTNVVINVKPMRKESQPPSENIKFCYSSSLGMPITSSKENCFRTGANIPYSLTFVNPLISPKEYKSYSTDYYITLTPQSSDDYLSLSFVENKYETKDRNIEGAGKIITIDSGETKKSTILTIPEVITNNKIIVQLQVCESGSTLGIVNYINYNAYTSEVISTGNTSKGKRFFQYEINNNLMETRVEFEGAEKDKIFVKHAAVSSYSIKTETYKATFEQGTNTVSIIKPILGEEFVITVLVGKPGRFDDYTLCTFMESEISSLGDYVKSFTSVTSDDITHYIDFDSIEYKEGYSFDLLVYAVQSKNTKLEFLYNVISGVVGKITNVFTPMRGTVENNIVSQEFNRNQTNYLYYDFTSNPVGDAASLRIKNEGESSVTISKVICTFVKKGLTDAEMLKIINEVPQGGTNLCKGDEKKNQNGFDALINAREVKNEKKRILIMIQYGFGENDLAKKENNEDVKDDSTILKINLRVSGFDVSESEKKFNEDETEALVPYVFDLTTIRGQAKDYISKVLIYSSKRELEMYHFQSGTPAQLFTGNILLVYTNQEVIKEKYQGAKTMILLTESLFKNKDVVIGENFRFKTYFFQSDNTMNYYVSSNPSGRPINIPTSLEMPDCSKPYYYILNYHYIETRDLTLHIDKIYGQISTKRIATELNQEDWYDLIASMDEFVEEEFLINKKSKYHMDVIEATCIIPTLLHIYYTDDSQPITEGLKPGDTSIINIGPSNTKEFKLQTNIMPGFTLVYSFNILSEDRDPNIRLSFPSGEPILATTNGVYLKKTKENFEKINVKNEDIGGSSLTRIIFKYGYEIEDKFEPLENDIYHFNETENLYGYKFKTDEDWLSYTSVDFLVSTTEENVKFCYSASFGSFMEPALQDCYRVGRANTYKLNLVNPYLMYKDYATAGDEIMKYYVGFKTVDQNQKIEIKPTLNKYSTKLRNLENESKSISVKKSNSTILTSPNSPYVFIQLQVCTENKFVEIDFFNAYNSTSLNHRDMIDNNPYFLSIENTRLDTLLSLSTDNTAKVFVRHSGIEDEYYPYVEDVVISYVKENKTITFKQPIAEEEFKYTVYIDHKGTFKSKNYNLCSFAENSKLAHFSKSVNSSDEDIVIEIDFDSADLQDYTDFDAMVLAEQINNGKIMILSNIISVTMNENNTTLIIIIIVLGIVLVGGGIAAFIFLKKYKNKPNSKKLDAKQTSLAMVDNENEKMIQSSATERYD